MDDPRLVSETAKRRTFAIISHPDAGKTTLTEKLLLYSGMLRTAGMVRGRKNSKATSSDWMALEQERGISITASAMQFPYKDAIINVLDTPGHQDFSEDTYRTLTAADCAVMVIDAAKGVEEQTRKLFAVCRMRKIPVLTFVNKLDLPSREILELLHEVEEVLGIRSSPRNWPIGYAKEFAGVIEIDTKEVSLFRRAAGGGSERSLMETYSLEQVERDRLIEPELLKTMKDDLELLAVAGNPFSQEEFLAGELTPVYFGSALTNFGVEPFFDAFVDIAPPPRAYRAIPKGLSDSSDERIEVSPLNDGFSGYVFKIQSNMNPKHRDSMAFIRVCSGKFERDLTVLHHRTGKEVRLSRSYSMLARDRDTVDEAFPGDIVGVINPGVFRIGDTVSANASAKSNSSQSSSGQAPLLSGQFNYEPIPTFPPEVVASVRPKDVMRKKSFDKGLNSLADEGTVQLFYSIDNPDGTPYVAAVGRLQFDVLQYRLRDEYNVENILESLPYRLSYLLDGDPKALKRTQNSLVVRDRGGRAVLLVSSEWEKRYIEEQNPQHKVKPFIPVAER